MTIAVGINNEDYKTYKFIRTGIDYRFIILPRIWIGGGQSPPLKKWNWNFFFFKNVRTFLNETFVFPINFFLQKCSNLHERSSLWRHHHNCRWNFHDNSKNNNWRIFLLFFSFYTAHSASSMKTRSKVRGKRGSAYP